MSVGSSTGRPARIAAITPLRSARCPPRLHDPLACPPRSRMIVAAVRSPAVVEQRRRLSAACPRAPRGRASPSSTRARRAASRSVWPSSTSATRGSQSRTSGSSAASSSGGDVRRVRDDEVERPRRGRRAGRPRRTSTSSPCALGVLARERERVRRDVGRGDARIRQLVRERQRDRAGAGADVDDARRLDACEQREAALDDDLGLGPRHERARVGLQRQAAEVPVAEHVGERLARGRAAARARARLRARPRVSGRSCCV